MRLMRERPEALTVVCGEALVDLFVAVGADGQLRSVPRLGGAPYNLAVGLARLGADVALCAGLSTDFFGAALRRGLEAEGVSAEFLEEFAEPTMLVVIGRQSDGRPSYGFPVKISADRQLTGRRFHEAHAPVDTLVLGSYLLVLPETQQRLLGILTDIRPDTLICLDPNVRLGIIPDGRLWLDAIEKFLPYADIIKASDEDIAALYPDATIDDVASAWRDNGAGLVVVTSGASGATAWFGDRQKLDVLGESVNVIDTVGAGDIVRVTTHNSRLLAAGRHRYSACCPACFFVAFDTNRYDRTRCNRWLQENFYAGSCSDPAAFCFIIVTN